NWYDPPNAPAVSVELKAFYCASDPSSPTRKETGVTNGVPWSAATTDYVPLREIDERLVAMGLVAPMASPQGGMPIGVITRPGEIPDGESHTLLLVEVAGRPDLWRVRLTPGTSPNGAWASAANPLSLRGSSYDGMNQPGECALNCVNADQLFSFHTGGAN